MTTGRETFLQRIRAAVAEGNQAGRIPALPDRGAVGYQGCGANPVERFGHELVVAGGVLHRVTNRQDATAVILHLVRDRAATRVLLGRGTVLDSLNLGDPLRASGIEVACVDALPDGQGRATVFAADIGISGVAQLVAETGTVVAATSPEEPRGLTLLPPVHIAVAERSQLVPDLFDLFTAWEGRSPACLSLITGPSKTGDIELRLVTGVHGPGEVHVVLIDPSNTAS